MRLRTNLLWKNNKFIFVKGMSSTFILLILTLFKPEFIPKFDPF